METRNLKLVIVGVLAGVVLTLFLLIIWVGQWNAVPASLCNAMGGICTPVPTSTPSSPTSSPSATSTPYVVVHVVDEQGQPVAISEIGVVEDTVCTLLQRESSLGDGFFSQTASRMGAYIQLGEGKLYVGATPNPVEGATIDSPYPCSPLTDTAYVQWPRWKTGKREVKFIVSVPTPTPTPTPPPYAEFLEDCEDDDFAAALTQESPVERTLTRRSTRAVPDLKTSFVLTNTGECMLVEGAFTVEAMTLENSKEQQLPELPVRLNSGEAVTLEYGWPPLVAGRHTVTFTLVHKNVYGRNSVLRPPEPLTLALELTIVLDRDGDGVPDDRDACPVTWGLPEFNGCPDTDGDGMPDKDDCCPDIPGILPLSGCPDADADGFPESTEMGCPGLPPMDRCPGEFGQDANCPGCTLYCRIEYDKCEIDVCERDPVSGEETCRTEQQDCNPHEVCEPCP